MIVTHTWPSMGSQNFNFTSDPITINNGIGKGEPSSMILYLIYSHILAAIPSSLGGDGGSYVNDTFWAAATPLKSAVKA